MTVDTLCKKRKHQLHRPCIAEAAASEAGRMTDLADHNPTGRPVPVPVSLECKDQPKYSGARTYTRIIRETSHKGSL
jgi:hypothetical protein